MENITTDYLNRAECWLIITTLFYFLMNGAQIFETLVFVPKWTDASPQNFYLLADKKGVSLKTFWIVLHSLHEITFIFALIYNWELQEMRNCLLLLFVVHFGVRVWTILYFAPKIMAFQKINNTEINPELEKQVLQWKAWNLLRVGIFIAVSIGMLLLCLDAVQNY